MVKICSGRSSLSTGTFYWRRIVNKTTYKAWITSHVAKTGLKGAAGALNRALADHQLGLIPVSEEITYREMSCSKVDFSVPANHRNEFFVVLPRTNGKEINYSRLPIKLRRTFLTEADAEEAAKEFKAKLDITTWQPGDMPLEYSDEDFDDTMMEGYIFLPTMFALTPFGFEDDKEKQLVPDIFREKLGVYEVVHENECHEGEIWIAYPTSLTEEEVFILSIVMALRSYGVLNPLDLPKMAEICSSDKKRGGISELLLNELENIYTKVMGLLTPEQEKELEEKKAAEEKLIGEIEIEEEDDDKTATSRREDYIGTRLGNKVPYIKQPITSLEDI